MGSMLPYIGYMDPMGNSLIHTRRRESTLSPRKMIRFNHAISNRIGVILLTSSFCMNSSETRHSGMVPHDIFTSVHQVPVGHDMIFPYHPHKGPPSYRFIL